MYSFLSDKDFRRSVSDNISKYITNGVYHTPTSFPQLHRYTKFSEYAVEDIINQRLTATNIREFNDIFDGVIHFTTNSDNTSEYEDEWNMIETIHMANGFQLSDKSYESFMNMKRNNARLMRTSAFSFLARLGLYICCFSVDELSTLMWSHYAGDNSGLCVSYNFNLTNENELIRSIILPVAYINKPIFMPNFFEIRKDKNDLIEKDVLSAVITKSKEWEYEKEWRMIFFDSFAGDHNTKRIFPTMPILPYRITFGYHFLKHLFVYTNEEDEKKKATENIDLLISILDYSRKNNINLAWTVPVLGTYELELKKLSADVLLIFINKHFKNKYLKNIHLYNVIQSELIEQLGKEPSDA